MKNPVPYLRQRPDSYWEIVFEDPETGKTRRKTTKTKNEEEAQKKLDEFQPDAPPVAPNAPRLRQRKDGYWETVYTDEEGKTRRHGHGTKIERDAEPLHGNFVKELARPEIPLRPTVAWVVDQYYDYICREKADSTSGPMAANVGPLKEHLGHLHWDEVVQDTVDEYIEWRMEKPRWKAHQKSAGQYGTTSRNTACKDLRVLRAALMRARKNRYTDYPPDFSITEGAPVRDTSVWLTMEEMERMIAACEPRPIVVNGKEIDRERNREHIEGFLLIALATGARKEAILSLTWDQVYIPEPTLKNVMEVEPEPVLDPDGNWVMPKRATRRTYENPPLNRLRRGQREQAPSPDSDWPELAAHELSDSRRSVTALRDHLQRQARKEPQERPCRSCQGRRRDETSDTPHHEAHRDHTHGSGGHPLQHHCRGGEHHRRGIEEALQYAPARYRRSFRGCFVSSVACFRAGLHLSSPPC